MGQKAAHLKGGGNHELLVVLPPHAAATATEQFPIFHAPDDAPEGVSIVAVELIPGDDVTGQATNYTNVNLINRGTDGSGTTELANIDLANGTDLEGHEPNAFYAPATPLSIAAGVVLEVQYEKVSSGLAIPGMAVLVTYKVN